MLFLQLSSTVNSFCVILRKRDFIYQFGPYVKIRIESNFPFVPVTVLAWFNSQLKNSKHKFSTQVIHVVDEMDTPTQEEHWGEILERTVSKQNLMLVNVGTNGTILNHQQTFPRFYKVEPIENKGVIIFTIKSEAPLG